MFVHYASKSAGRGAVLTPCGLITSSKPQHSTRKKTLVSCPCCLSHFEGVRHA